MSKKALVVVDMQNDFIDGALGNKECQAVVSKVVECIESGAYSTIIATRDTHHEDYLNTQEGKKLPVVHCIKNTKGWEINQDVKKAMDARQDVELHIIDKESFGSLLLADALRELNGYGEIDFCGVCTGICVISNATIAKATLPEATINIIADACACVTPESHKTALEAMKLLQMNIV